MLPTTKARGGQALGLVSYCIMLHQLLREQHVAACTGGHAASLSGLGLGVDAYSTPQYYAKSPVFSFRPHGSPTNGIYISASGVNEKLTALDVSWF